jgi:hypothetical protein
MKKIILITIGLLFIILLIVIIIRLLGYSLNKEYFSFNRQECIDREYPTYYHHSGIEGCIFWVRADYLEKSQEWAKQFVRDDEYCNQLSNNDDSSDGYKSLFAGEYVDPKCSYSAFKDKKRKENWDYLISKDKDGIYEYCVEQSCPRPKLLK